MCDFRLGLSCKVVITFDFLREIYSSAAKNLDFMRVCESVVMNIGTTSERVMLVPIFYFITISHPLHCSSFFAKSHSAPALFACKRAHNASACYQLFAGWRYGHLPESILPPKPQPI